MFSLARALLSADSAEDRSSLFVRFIDTRARSDSSGACASALPLWAFAAEKGFQIQPAPQPRLARQTVKTW